MRVDDSPGDFESALKPLWLRAQSGDDAAYRQALGLLKSRLRAFLKHRLSGLPDEVEDLVQEKLLTLHLQRGTYDPTLPVSACAVAIARHKLVDLWRRRGRRDNLHDAIDKVDEQLLATETDDGGARRALEALFGALPHPQRQVILARPGGLPLGGARPCPDTAAGSGVRGGVAGRLGGRLRLRTVLSRSLARVRGHLVHAGDRLHRGHWRRSRASCPALVSCPGTRRHLLRSTFSALALLGIVPARSNSTAVITAA